MKRWGIVFLAMCLAAVAAPPAASATPPVIEVESVSGVGAADATLEARINPKDTERGAYYQFQLVSDTSQYFPEFACPTDRFPAGSSLCLTLQSRPDALPIAWTGPGLEGKSVNLDLNGGGVTLQPDTTYHYRVIAARAVQTVDTIAWEAPIVYGPNRTFTTTSEGAPRVDSESASVIAPTDATLEADIDPNGLETNYRFRVVASPCQANPLTCELPTDPLFPQPAGTIAASDETQHVSVDLAAAGMTLQPATEYHYSAFASNGEGESSGPDQTFTTLPEPPNPSKPNGGSGGPVGGATTMAVSTSRHRHHHHHGRHRRHRHHHHHKGRHR